ncbi:MAG: WGR domain-containing protein [Xanthobacteraceae bacterium]|jgi:predicted DNA-binding WGR domain protein
MSNGKPLYLRRINPSLNMRRFYMLSIQPTLFGGAALVRNWGRIGASGHALIETFDCPDQADGALRRLEHRKRCRGYVDN